MMLFVQALIKLLNQTILGQVNPARATLLYRVPQKGTWLLRGLERLYMSINYPFDHLGSIWYHSQN